MTGTEAGTQEAALCCSRKPGAQTPSTSRCCCSGHRDAQGVRGAWSEDAGSNRLSATGTNTFPPHINQSHQPQLTGRAGQGRRVPTGARTRAGHPQGSRRLCPQRPRAPPCPASPGVGAGGTPTSTLIREKVRGLMGGHRWGEVIG